MPKSGIILIVDDSEPCITTLETLLLGLNDFETRSARNGLEAVAILRDVPVRAMITDLQLPGMDGFALIEHVRHRAAQAALPIVVISGDSDPDNRERLRLIGVDAYFVKPYSPAALRRTLEKLLHAP